MSIILCADDFGQNAPISEGILELASHRRLSAVSCMTQMPDFKNYAPALCALKKQEIKIKTGLHFNLTHPIPETSTSTYKTPTQSKSLACWLLSSQIRWINKSDIAQRFHQQCDAFENQMGSIPDFIDGHQHVHALPIIRDIIINIIQKRYGHGTKHTMPQMRNLKPLPHSNQNIKMRILNMLTRGFNQALKTHDIPHNTYFSGVYDLKPTHQFKNLISYWFEQALKNTPNETLIMCHPGLASNDASDPIRATRIQEWEVLRSDWFGERYASALWI